MDRNPDPLSQYGSGSESTTLKKSEWRLLLFFKMVTFFFVFVLFGSSASFFLFIRSDELASVIVDDILGEPDLIQMLSARTDRWVARL
jgi:hypothetical protein